MNLDAFKNDLKEQLDNQAMQASKSSVDHAQMLRKRTNSLLARLLRSLRIELYFAVAVGLAGLVVGITAEEQAYAISGYGILLICVVVGLACIPIYKKLQKLRHENPDLRDMLTDSIAVTSTFLKFYIWYTVAMVPVGGMLGFLSGSVDPSDESLLDKLHLDIDPWLAATIFLVIFMGLMTWFAWWYINKMYGRHLKALRQCLQDLEEQQEL